MKRRFEKRSRGKKIFRKTANRVNVKNKLVSRGGTRF